MIKEFEEVPFSPEMDFNPKATTWQNGRCVKLDEGTFVTYYAGHHEETRTEMQGEKMDREIEVKVMKACPVRVKKGVTSTQLLTVCPEEYVNEILPLFVADNFDAYKSERNDALIAFDKSLDVNSFYLNGHKEWLHLEKRVGLMNSTQITKAAGGKETTLWFNGYKYVLPCDMAIAMLSQLELYALACYNRTAEHQAILDSITDPQLLISYDFTTGYPQKPEFNI